MEIGVRVNPGFAEVECEMYNPCGPCSRPGITPEAFAETFGRFRAAVDGLHFHALCEQNSDVLEEGPPILRKTLRKVHQGIEVGRISVAATTSPATTMIWSA